MSPGFGSNHRIDARDAGHGVGNAGEMFFFAGQCGLIAALAGFAGVLIFLLLK